MPRRPRVQLSNGVFHVTGRGNRRQLIFRDVDDRLLFLGLLDVLRLQRGWLGHAYCLLPNHYHLLIETPAEDLSAGMQWLNGRYAQAFNERHACSGHLFQGRFHSDLVDGDGHLLELCRYLALNPVRAGLCTTPAAWTWQLPGDRRPGAPEAVPRSRPGACPIRTKQGTRTQTIRVIRQRRVDDPQT